MTKSAAPPTIRLFGAPEIEIDDRPLVLKNQKARALLFYLALTGQPHTRSHLAALLWSDLPADNARRSLRVALFQLRRALEPYHLDMALVSEGDLLRLQIDSSCCDATQFLHLVTIGSQSALTQAVNLYRGPLLKGFTLPNALLFDDWLQLEDEKLTRLYLGALKQLADKAIDRNEQDRALEYFQRLVQADPLDEEAQQQLIRLYLEIDAPNQALRQYQQFESELQKKLGLLPSPEMRALFQEGLRRQQRPLPSQTVTPIELNEASQMLLPFVGRDRLMTELLTVSQKVREGRGATVLLQGDGGIGKTRLLREFLIRLTDETLPWLVLQGASSPFDDLISYGPFLEAFQDSPLGDLTDLLLPATPEALVDRDQYVYRILQMLRRLSQNAPLVLAIDDLQWANSSTLNLFGLLATRLHHLPLLLVGTVQRLEAIPALQRLVTVERRRGQLQVLPVPPLPEAAVVDLLHDLAVNPASVPSLATWLQERSGGNPFVLHEMVDQLRADAILTPAGDYWHLDPKRWLRWRATYRLPETTYDLVSWRLRDLPMAAHRLLEVLAVAGQPLPFALLADFPGIEVKSLLPLIDDLLVRRLLVETGHDMFALSHDVLRETILHRLSQIRRRLLHRQLAQALVKCPALRANFPLWEVARHAVAGEDVDLSRRYGLQILPQLPQDYTGAVTVDFLHHLTDLLAPSASPDEMLQLTRAMGEVHQSLGHLPEATYWQQQYLELARKTGDAAIQATAYLEKGELALVSNDYVAATAAAEAGLAACALLSPEASPFNRLSARGHRLLGAALAMEGSDLPAAERHLRKACDWLRSQTPYVPVENPRDLSASLFELGNVAAQRGNLVGALEFYEEAAQVAAVGQIHYIHALACNNNAYHNLLLGRLPAAQQALARGQRLAETHELLGALLHLLSTQGEIHLYLAEWEEARQTFYRGLALAEELGNPERQAGYRAGLAMAARGQHDYAGAITLLEEATLLINDRGYLHLRTRLLLWLAETCLWANRIAEAWVHLDTALQTAQAHSRKLLHLQAVRLRASLLAAGGNWHEAEESFNEMLVLASLLNLPLEIARTKAAWGRAMGYQVASSEKGHTLLSQAREIFAAYGAKAELGLVEVQGIHPHNDI